jgi:HD-GYP domain-containing protein (c-di-GMP phosphodiesterase class II)
MLANSFINARLAKLGFARYLETVAFFAATARSSVPQFSRAKALVARPLSSTLQAHKQSLDRPLFSAVFDIQVKPEAKTMSILTKLAGAMGLKNAPSSGSSSSTEEASALLASLLTMAWFVEARDPYTGGHLWRVSRYADMVAERSGMSAAQAARISLGGFLHDLGKIGVPDAVLRKADQLTPEEYEIIKTHPNMGARMLAGHPLAGLVRDAVRLHHERPDGQGYPLGLFATDTPEMARVIGVCDAFDAMTSHRPYRPGMPLEKALRIIAAARGSQFDERFADALIELGNNGDLNHVMGHSDEGIPLQNCPMCGPTLVLTRRNQAGQCVYCRNCASEFELVSRGTGLLAKPTGRTGRASDLQPELDIELVERTVNEAVAALPRSELFKTLLV